MSIVMTHRHKHMEYEHLKKFEMLCVQKCFTKDLNEPDSFLLSCDSLSQHLYGQLKEGLILI